MSTCWEGKDGRRDLSFCETVSNGENGMKRALLSTGRVRNSGAVMNDEIRMLHVFLVRLKVLYNMMSPGKVISMVLENMCGDRGYELGFNSGWKACDVGARRPGDLFVSYSSL